MPVPETIKSEFNDVVAFHRCYCLDIAMGYRVAKALMREMGEDMRDLKHVIAYAGAPTCAVDAIQKIAGCTLGKRNLIYTNTGKSVFALQNTRSGRTVRAYVHYWDTFDQLAFRAQREKASAATTPGKKAEFKEMLDAKIEEILTTAEGSLFRITESTMATPQKSGKFISERCDSCGEYAKADLLVEHEGNRVCRECLARPDSA